VLGFNLIQALGKKYKSLNGTQDSDYKNFTDSWTIFISLRPWPLVAVYIPRIHTNCDNKINHKINHKTISIISQKIVDHISNYNLFKQK
jgi:hypothetical protein